LAVGAFNDARVVPLRIQPIEKPCQQDRAGAIDSIELRQVDIN
jgi:hypothetical protein